MTKNTRTKETVRARMAITGENYLTAYRALFETKHYLTPWDDINQFLDGGLRPGLHVVASASLEPAAGAIMGLVTQNHWKTFMHSAASVWGELGPRWEGMAQVYGGENRLDDIRNETGSTSTRPKYLTFRGIGGRHKGSSSNYFDWQNSIQDFLIGMRENCLEFQSEVLVLDYYQILTKGHTKDDYQELAEGLQKLSRELNIPVILQTQLSTNANSQPSDWSSLRGDYGMLNEYADTIMTFASFYTQAYNSRGPKDGVFGEEDLVRWVKISVDKTAHGTTGETLLQKEKFLA